MVQKEESSSSARPGWRPRVEVYVGSRSAEADIRCENEGLGTAQGVLGRRKSKERRILVCGSLYVPPGRRLDHSRQMNLAFDRELSSSEIRQSIRGKDKKKPSSAAEIGAPDRLSLAKESACRCYPHLLFGLPVKFCSHWELLGIDGLPRLLLLLLRRRRRRPLEVLSRHSFRSIRA